MSLKAKFKAAVSDWRLICQNYIGSLGYYLLFLALVLVVVRFVLQLSQYVIYYQPAPQVKLADSVTRVAYSPGFLEGLIVYSLSLVMIASTVAILLLIPYAIGYVSGKLMRVILRMTGLEVGSSNLFKLKYGYCLAMAVITLLTVYDYDLAIESNWYGVLLLGLSLAALGLFWVQARLVKFWKIKASKLF